MSSPSFYLEEKGAFKYRSIAGVPDLLKLLLTHKIQHQPTNRPPQSPTNKKGRSFEQPSCKISFQIFLNFS